MIIHKNIYFKAGQKCPLGFFYETQARRDKGGGVDRHLLGVGGFILINYDVFC